MKIYTKTGDRGMTGTLKGRIGKGEQLAVALGTIDELNSWIGLCRRKITNHKSQTTNIEKELKRIQNNLLTIGSELAGSQLRIQQRETDELEKLIDQLTEQLPKLNNFIFPTGTGGAEYIQVARAVSRRAEREVVKLVTADEEVLKYLNRLSDGLFTLARWVNQKNKGKEEVW